MAGVVAAAGLGLGVIGVVAGQLDGDSARLQRRSRSSLAGLTLPPTRTVSRMPCRTAAVATAIPWLPLLAVTSAASGRASATRATLLWAPRVLKAAGRLDLLALQPHLGRAGRLGQLRARLERRVERRCRAAAGARR